MRTTTSSSRSARGSFSRGFGPISSYRASGANAAYQIAQVYGGGLIPILAGLVLDAYGIHTAYIYIGGLVMIYAVLAILAIIYTPETKGADLEK